MKKIFIYSSLLSILLFSSLQAKEELIKPSFLASSKYVKCAKIYNDILKNNLKEETKNKKIKK